VFQYGRFSADDARMAALALAAMSIGVPAFMLSKVLAPAFYARQDTRTRMRVALVTVAINVALTVAIVTPLWLNQVRGAHAGIALATSLAGVANAALLWLALRRAGLHRPQAGWVLYLLRLGAACAVMVTVLLVMRSQIGDWGSLATTRRLILLLGVIAGGAASYGLTLLLAGWRPGALRARA
jgi:putative peptidoglycan lipid II flippase